MAVTPVGGIIKNGDSIAANGDYYIKMQSQVNITAENDFGGGTVSLFQGTSTASAQTLILSGSTAATDDFSHASACGEIRVNLAGATAPDIDFFLSPIYSAP